MALDMLTGREEIPEDQKQIPGVHPHMRPSPRGQRFQQYPRMLYKGPTDPTGQTKLVNSVEEEKAALQSGWRLRYPLPESEQLDASSKPAEVHRGPGRARKVE